MAIEIFDITKFMTGDRILVMGQMRSGKTTLIKDMLFANSYKPRKDYYDIQHIHIPKVHWNRYDHISIEKTQWLFSFRELEYEYVFIGKGYGCYGYFQASNTQHDFYNERDMYLTVDYILKIGKQYNYFGYGKAGFLNLYNRITETWHNFMVLDITANKIYIYRAGCWNLNDIYVKNKMKKQHDKVIEELKQLFKA